MEIHLLLFGIAKDLVGKQKLKLKLPELTTVADFKKLLREKHPELHEIESISVAVNSEYASDAHLINHNDEIALIPPVSGG
ncbi:UNVERIFIED_CONTAM: hypothetical protein GTU68_014980 [Idotea baltica]|nr:hypothetical protein [Idotea baltica]